MHTKELTIQSNRLRAGYAPDEQLACIMEKVADDTRYHGVIFREDGEYWPDQQLYNVNFYANSAATLVRKYIRNATTRTTASASTMHTLHRAIQHAVDNALANLP